MSYQHIILEEQEAIGIITLNRPKVLNALNNEMMQELAHAIDRIEHQSNKKVIVIKGDEKHFAVGADIRELMGRNHASNFKDNFITEHWERIAHCRIPTSAAVAGFVMGAGCELAMMCDMIIAADNARFSQPEISIGLLPGAGGTQRLPRAIGKAKAMDLCLTGRFMEVDEAEKLGLVSRVVPLINWWHETMMIAERISHMSKPVAMMVKESINRGYEQSLAEGLKSERRMFHSLFAFDDPKEGMEAFVEKRPAVFKDS